MALSHAFFVGLSPGKTPLQISICSCLDCFLRGSGEVLQACWELSLPEALTSTLQAMQTKPVKVARIDKQALSFLKGLFAKENDRNIWGNWKIQWSALAGLTFF